MLAPRHANNWRGCNGGDNDSTIDFISSTAAAATAAADATAAASRSRARRTRSSRPRTEG
jgi:hypothetical protein